MEISSLKRFIEIKQQIKELEKEKNNLQAKIRASFDFGTHEIDGVKVIRSTRSRLELDKAGILELIGINAYKSFEKPNEYEVIQVETI